MYTISVPNELLDAHECEALVITCMDFRFREATQAFVKDGLGIEKFDLVTLPGAGKGTAENTVLGEVNALSVEIARRLHRVQRIIIVHHETCGAYGMPDAAKEVKKQSADLRKARNALAAEFPTLSIQLFFARKKDGTVKYVRVD